MAARAFGQYLIDRGFITADQLCEALDIQLEVNPLIGDLVVASGWMTPAQVEEVNVLQRSTDQRFGEICLAKGFLSETQVSELLDSQRAKRRLLGQILFDLDYLTADQLERCLADHAAEQAGAQTKDEAIALGDAEVARLARAAVDQMTRQYLRTVKRPIGLAAVVPIADNPDVLSKARWLQTMQGDGEFALLLAIDEDVEVEIAAAVDQQLTSTDFDMEAVHEAVRTFLNLVGSHMASAEGYAHTDPVYVGEAKQLSDYVPIFKAVMDAGGRPVNLLLARAQGNA